MPRTPDVRCPDCKGMLVSVRLGVFIDAPNKYRTLVYTCKNCSIKSGFQKIFFLKKMKLKLKKKRKVFALPNNIKRLTGMYRILKHHTPVPETKIPTRYCLYCKTKLYYDRFSSLVHNDGMRLNVRSYFHFDCPKSKDDETTFTFIRARIGKIETVRILQT